MQCGQAFTYHFHMLVTQNCAQTFDPVLVWVSQIVLKGLKHLDSLPSYVYDNIAGKILAYHKKKD